MLARLENAYLFILRVVVLVAATLALIGVLVGLGRAALYLPSILAPKAVTAEVPGGSLGDYVAEKQPQGVTLASPTGVTPNTASPSIMAAAHALEHYEVGRNSVQVDDAAIIVALTQKQSTLPFGEQAKYGDSLSALMTELDQSKGTPLNTDQISDLIDWHLAKFRANADAITAEHQASQLQALQTLSFALAGFGVFIGVVFCFLIVKIERNLRLVRTLSADSTAGAA